MTAPCDAEVAAAILSHVQRRGADKSICPSEVARSLGADWRSMMPKVREIAAQLALKGAIEVTQKGKTVDAVRARGPIRLRAIAQHSD